MSPNTSQFSFPAIGTLVALLAVHVCLAAEGGPKKSAQGSPRPLEAGQAFVPPILPPAGHPRLLLRSTDLPEMRRRLGEPAFTRFAKRVRALSESGWNGELPVPERFDSAPRNWMEWGRSSRGLAPSKTQNYDPRLHDLIEFCALRYVVEQNEAMGKRAIQLLETVLATVTFPNKKEAMDITRGKGATITTAAIVYDWCYPLLSSPQKASIIAHIRRIAAMLEVGFPPVRAGAVVGHGGEANIFRDLTAAGIAVYDEDPEIYQLTAKRLFEEHIPARNYFYPSHWHHQGSSYGHVRAKWELWCACIFQRMAGARVFAEGQEQLLYGTYYSLRPDHIQMADGDGSAIPKKWGSHPTADVNGELLSVFLSHDPVIAGMLQKHITMKDDLTDTLPYFLFAQPQLPTQPLETLPLSRYFKDPSGVMLARTGWQEGKESPTVVAMMKIAPWMFGNHQHLDAGHFQIWYKGMLAVDSGAYAGYGSAHWANYYQRSVAHNTVTVKDPQEQFIWIKTPVANDGGQRWPQDGREPVTLDELLKQGYQAGEVLAHQIGPDPARPIYSHLCGKIQSYGPKVENFTRSFLFLNLGQKDHPAVLAVYDRVRSANPSFAKSWLLHALEKPSVEPDGFAVPSLWGGRMDASVLLPAKGNYALKMLGGPGAQYLADGKNYPISQSSGSDDEGAGWRLELSPTLPQKQDRFLVVMQVHDNQPASRPLPVTSLETADCIGFQIADHAVLFPKGDGLLEGAITLDLPGNHPMKVTVTGLAAGSWSAQGQGNTLQGPVTEAGHLAHFDALAGKVELKRIDGGKTKQ
ncbi:MAG: heparinase II/III family protein [Verrucomicrobiota bacterium]